MVHSNYDTDTYENDVAIFKLIRSVRFSDYVQPICLPETAVLIKADYPCFITGWGHTREKGNFYFSFKLNCCEEYYSLKFRKLLCHGHNSGLFYKPKLLMSESLAHMITHLFDAHTFIF